jgi:NADH:ubiquinone oxidoreductase subunit F (NADH-binding)
MLTSWTKGEASSNDMQTIEDLMKAMRLTSICGLGQIVPAPLTTVLKHFPAMIESHLKKKQCPAGVCFQPGQ